MVWQWTAKLFADHLKLSFCDNLLHVQESQRISCSSAMASENQCNATIWFSIRSFCRSVLWILNWINLSALLVKLTIAMLDRLSSFSMKPYEGTFWALTLCLTLETFELCYHMPAWVNPQRFAIVACKYLDADVVGNASLTREKDRSDHAVRIVKRQITLSVVI